MNTIDKMILEDKYSGSIDAAKDFAANTMAQLKESYGDDLLSAIQYYTNFNTLEEYEQSVYINQLQQEAVTDYAKTQIKDDEIKKYYKEESKPDIKVSYILIDVNYASDASDEDKTKADEEAKKKADEVLSKLKGAKNVGEKFAELAKEYSADTSTKDDGGNLGYINTNTLGDTYKNVVDAAYELKDGEYTKTAVKSDVGYNIVYRAETKEKASLEEVRDSIIQTLAEKYVTEHQEAQIKAMQNLRKEYDMDIIDSELKDNYTNYIQNSLAKIQEEANKAKETTNSTNK